MDRTDLELVLAVRQQGSLAAAARALGLAPPAVTKRLAALEQSLGLRLFQRTTRRVSPTGEGETVCRHAQQVLAGFAALESELLDRRTEPVGPIRLASSLGFGRVWLGPALSRFQLMHPGVRIELHLGEQLPDLESAGFDGAVWLWAVRGHQAAQRVSRRLARNRRVLVASPAYLAAHGHPASLDALRDHACLVVRENTDAPGTRLHTWELTRERDRAALRVPISGPLTSNSGELVRDWCLAGHGIMLRSLWDIAPQLASGELVQVLPQWSMTDADIHWVAPSRPQTPRRIRLLIDHLVEQFRTEPWRTAPAPR